VATSSSGPSSDASLSAITIAGATPDSVLGPLYCTLPNDFGMFTIVVHTSSPNVTVVYEDNEYDHAQTGTHTWEIYKSPLPTGENALLITVTAPDGITQQTYTLTVRRLAEATSAVLTLNLSTPSAARSGTLVISGSFGSSRSITFGDAASDPAVDVATYSTESSGAPYSAADVAAALESYLGSHPITGVDVGRTGASVYLSTNATGSSATLAAECDGIDDYFPELPLSVTGADPS
jgi:hypothetical protein